MLKRGNFILQTNLTKPINLNGLADFAWFEHFCDLLSSKEGQLEIQVSYRPSFKSSGSIGTLKLQAKGVCSVSCSICGKPVEQPIELDETLSIYTESSITSDKISDEMLLIQEQILNIAEALDELLLLELPTYPKHKKTLPSEKNMLYLKITSLEPQSAQNVYQPFKTLTTLLDKADPKEK